MSRQEFSNSQAFIQFALERKVIQFGEFTLKSKRVAPYFFNTGLFNDGQSLERLGRFYAAAILEADLKPDLLFGPAYKGIPLVAAVATALSREHGLNLPYAFNRKEAKSYGDKGTVVGAPLKGQVLIVDDVLTAGTAVDEATTLIQAHGACVLGVVIAFDRKEWGTVEGRLAVDEVRQRHGIEVLSVASIEDLIEQAENGACDQEQVARIRAYLQRFGQA
ncbi:MAG: orotate phosphoribosyltransferase [Gammaproteobacteria bacterium]|nr:orotate phosphoribosyltransferase [Gammaproteobacteria bacterium]